MQKPRVSSRRRNSLGARISPRYMRRRADAFLLCSKESRRKHDAAFSFDTLSITPQFNAALRASAWSARHAAARLVPQPITSGLEEKKASSKDDSGRGPSPRMAGWNENREDKATIQRARTRDCAGRRSRRYETVRIATLIEVAFITGFITCGSISKPANAARVIF
jgi:hypothetical protein